MAEEVYGQVSAADPLTWHRAVPDGRSLSRPKWRSPKDGEFIFLKRNSLVFTTQNISRFYSNTNWTHNCTGRQDNWRRHCML